MQYKNGKKVSDSIALLISILVKYPEVGSINYDPQFHTLKFSFMVTAILDTMIFKRLNDKVTSCLNTYFYLTNSHPEIVNLEKKECDHVTVLEVTRDVFSLTKEEISMLTELFRMEFNKKLLLDTVNNNTDNDLISEQLIDKMLKNFKGQTPQKKLIAYREEGRVMVFNK